MKRILLGCAAAFAVAAAGTTASAATIIDAARIRVMTNITVLQVGELQAFEYGTGVNVALASNGATATSNQSYDGDHQAPRAIDGSTNTDFYTSPYIYHGTNTGAFLDVTFAAPKTLSSLTIFGRGDSFSDRDLFDVEIFDLANNSIFAGQVDARGENHFGTLQFDAPTNAGTPGAVPEPATWAMMLGGFFGMGGVLRRRGRLVAA